MDDTLAALQRRQETALGLDTARPLTRYEDADRFLARVGVALRYGPTKGLPLASLYRVLAGEKPAKRALAGAITLTNRLLGEARGIEVHVVADRVCVAHRSMVPALYALV